VSDTVGQGGRALREEDEERRYRDTLERDPTLASTIDLLFERLGDASWRVRRAAAERLARGDPALTLPRLLDALEAGSGPSLRAAAGEALVLVGASALGPLAEALESPTPEVRTAAAEILGDLGDRRAVLSLRARLADRDPNTRVAAAVALGKLGGEEAVAGLRAALDPSDGDLARAILDALLRLRSPLPGPQLERLSSDRGLRRPVLRLAGMSDEPVALKLLAQGLEDRSRGVREAALAGIGHHRQRRGHRQDVLAAAVHEALARTPELPESAAAVLSAGELTVRTGALAVLSWIGQARHVSAIATCAEDDRLRPLVAEALAAIGPSAGKVLSELLPTLPPVPRVVAAAALSRFSDPGAFLILEEALGSEAEAARDLAIEALGRTGDARAVAALAPLLSDEDPAVSGAAVSALVELSGHEEVRRSVLEACRTRLPASGPALLRLLGRIGEAEDVTALRVFVRSAHPETRVAAVGALSALGARLPAVAWPLPELFLALEDLDDAVRAAAARALGLLAAKGSGRLLEQGGRSLALALGDPSPVVRAEAAIALGRCGAVEYVEALRELARDFAASTEAAAAALHALTDLKAQDPVLLQEAARHADPELVKEAVRAASGLPGTRANALLLEAARHPRWDVRRAAAHALSARGEPALVKALRELALEEKDPLVMEELSATLRDPRGRA